LAPHGAGQIRDIVVANMGADPLPVHSDGWKIEGCPHSGPSVFLDNGGTRHMLWYTGASGRSGIYYARDSGNGTPTLPVGVVTGQALPVAHVSLAVSERLGPVAAFDVTAEKKRRIPLSRVDVSATVPPSILEIPGTAGGLYPQVVAFEDQPTAIVAWTQPRDGRNLVGLAALEWKL
jgi:hypothetical protein